MLQILRRYGGASGAGYALMLVVVGLGAALGLVTLRDALPGGAATAEQATQVSW